jgi:NAD(P)-dependent dehydrogenase (short-subunit alcohol dehydrogenase family)
LPELARFAEADDAIFDQTVAINLKGLFNGLREAARRLRDGGEVATRIVASAHFAGRSFSLGDKYIADTANDKDGPGNATSWRRVNTVHHLTRVVADLGPQRGYQIVEREDVPEPEQIDLFGEAR